MVTLLTLGGIFYIVLATCISLFLKGAASSDIEDHTSDLDEKIDKILNPKDDA